MATYDLVSNSIILTNMLSDGGMESSLWNGGSYTTSQYHSGSRSLYLASGGTYVPTLPVATLPIVGHKYYAARWIKSDGNNQPADCRWEWFAGDGVGLNFVFGWNRGYHASWERESIIYPVTAVNGSNYSIRCFVVNSTANTWVDDMILVDLTVAFGAGNEPDKTWCDTNIPYFASTMSIPVDIKVKSGDILNCPYSGTYKSITLPKGIYKLECWGAQGGNAIYSSSTGYGGKGGYSYGILSLSEETLLYLSSGGQGIYTTTSGGVATGGWNGGGNGYNYSTTYIAGSGGGSSDIRLLSNSLYSRILVAGAGGGGGAYNTTTASGGCGGGLNGAPGGTPYSSYSGGTGGSQTGAGYTTGSTNFSTSAGFGYGGYKTSGSGGWNGAGGGSGWYGGGAGAAVSACGGGGSGYVYTSSTYSNYPSGCLLNSSYYLTEASTVAGDASFIDYSGSTVTGHSGNGAIRITIIEISSISSFVKINGVWKSASSMHVKVGDTWKTVSSIKSNIGGTWK